MKESQNDPKKSNNKRNLKQRKRHKGDKHNRKEHLDKVHHKQATPADGFKVNLYIGYQYPGSAGPRPAATCRFVIKLADSEQHLIWRP